MLKKFYTTTAWGISGYLGHSEGSVLNPDFPEGLDPDLVFLTDPDQIGKLKRIHCYMKQSF